MRIAINQRDKNAEESDGLVLTVVQNRIVQGEGIWAGTSGADYDDEMLLQD